MTTTLPGGPTAVVDLVVASARLVVTMDDDRSEVPGGWVAIDGGVVVGVGPSGGEPPARRRIDAGNALVTPGLVNAHHHIYQNLTRALPPSTEHNLFGWLTELYPIWARLDEEASYLSAWVGFAELMLGGCTTTMDHLYVHPRGAGDLISAEISAAVELGMRFHATRGSMSRSRKDGGLPPDEVVQDSDEILADSERLVGLHHDRSPHAMVQMALAPCSPFSVSSELMTATAELAERLDVRLHTHLAEDVDEDVYCQEMYGCRPLEYFESVGWASDRSWVAHCVHPNGDEIDRMARWGTAVAHCPSSNQILGAGLAPIREFRDAGVAVGLGCDGSSSADSGSLWLETRAAMLLARLRGGGAAMQAREALEMATRGGAQCLGRQGQLGELSVGAAGDLVVWPLDGVRFAGAWADPVEALLRCGPNSAKYTVIAGKVVVDDGRLVAPGVDDVLRRHEAVARRWQQ